MSSAIRIRIATAIAALMTVAGVAACGVPEEGTAASSSTPSATPIPEPAAVDPAQCSQVPPTGHIDRIAQDLYFTTGHALVTVGDTTPAPATRPAPTPQPQPPADGAAPAPTPSSAPSEAPASEAPLTDTSGCFRFDRWGDPAPEVPPDSMLFLFKGAGTSGLQIEFYVGDLTGGVLPPVGDVRPRVGPLVAPIPATIGLSVDGKYFQATRCSLKVTAMASARAAGSFSCPPATATDANPFDPSDDVSYDDPTESTTPRPSQPETVSLSGLFDLIP